MKFTKLFAAENGGWVVEESKANEMLQLYADYVGSEHALEALARAMGNDELFENLEYIFRVEEFEPSESMEKSNPESIWNAFEEWKMYDPESSLLSLEKAMGTEELAENLAYIFRMEDFKEAYSEEN